MLGRPFSCAQLFLRKNHLYVKGPGPHYALARGPVDGMQCSGVEWNGVDGMQCSGVEWNGVDGMQCSGVECPREKTEIVEK